MRANTLATSKHLPRLKARAALLCALSLSLSLFSFSAAPQDAFAITAAEKQAEAAAAYDKLAAVQHQLDQASDNYFTALSELEAAQTRMKEAQAAIDAATEKISTLQSHLGTRARSMYVNGSLSFLDILLGATTFQAFTSNWDFLNEMNQADADMVSETKNLREEVERQKITFAEQEKIAAEKTAEAEKIMADAQSLVAEAQSIYDSLSAEAAELLEQERRAREAAAAAAAASVMDRAKQYADSSNIPEPSYDVTTGNAIVDRAYGWLGKANYVWGGCSPGAFDCSGFVSYALTGAYSRLGTTYTFLKYAPVSDPQPGDIAVNSGHCGIYIGGGQMIHSATDGQGVIIGPVQAGMIFTRY